MKENSKLNLEPFNDLSSDVLEYLRASMRESIGFWCDYGNDLENIRTMILEIESILTVRYKNERKKNKRMQNLW